MFVCVWSRDGAIQSQVTFSEAQVRETLETSAATGKFWCASIICRVSTLILIRMYYFWVFTLCFNMTESKAWNRSKPLLADNWKLEQLFYLRYWLIIEILDPVLPVILLLRHNRMKILLCTSEKFVQPYHLTGWFSCFQAESESAISYGYPCTAVRKQILYLATDLLGVHNYLSSWFLGLLQYVNNSSKCLIVWSTCSPFALLENMFSIVGLSQKISGCAIIDITSNVLYLKYSSS